MQKYKLRYLLSLSDRGIVSKKTSLPPFKRAIAAGLYLGCPGKEIFYGLNLLSRHGMERLAAVVADKFPDTPQRSVHLSAFFRYVYGCFDKQGCLNGDDQAAAMIKEKRDWSKSDEFVDVLISSFKEISNRYGELISYEMKAHRVGDTVIIRNDMTMLPKMLLLYDSAGQIAEEIMARKNVCSAYYWAFRYLYYLKQPEYYHYAMKFLNNVEKYSNSSTIKGKVRATYNMLKSSLPDADWQNVVEIVSGFTKKSLQLTDG